MRLLPRRLMIVQFGPKWYAGQPFSFVNATFTLQILLSAVRCGRSRVQREIMDLPVRQAIWEYFVVIMAVTKP